MKKLLIFVAIFCSTALAIDEFYSTMRSVRAMGMGGAFYGLSDDESALFYNPAGLANYRGEPKMMLSFGADLSSSAISNASTLWNIVKGNINETQVLDSLGTLPGDPVYVEARAMPFFYLSKDFAVGFVLADPKAELTLLGAQLDSSVDLTLLSDSGIFVGYAKSFMDDALKVGITGKGILRIGGTKQYSILELAQQSTFSFNPENMGGAGFGIDFDVGAIYDVPNLPFGLLNQVSLTFNNVMASTLSMFTLSGYLPPPGLERTVSLGFHSVFAGVGIIDNFHVLLDFSQFAIGGLEDPNLGARYGSFFKHVDLGLEVPIRQFFVLRTGLYQGAPTFGFGFRTPYFDADFATYSEQDFLGLDRLTSQRYALQISFGLGAAPPPPVSARHASPSGSGTGTTQKTPSPKGVDQAPAPLMNDIEIRLEQPEIKEGPAPVQHLDPAPPPPPFSSPRPGGPPPQASGKQTPKLTTPPPPDNDRFEVDKLLKEEP